MSKPKRPGAAYVGMTPEQWGFVRLALDYVMQRAYDPAKPTDFQAIDLFGRRIVRRRVRECMAEIDAQVTVANPETK